MTSGNKEGETAAGFVHGSWGRAAEFFVTMLGFAVGLGNVWRFPNVVYRYGGGAFFIPYILAVFVVGIPLFLLESSIGQYSRKNSVEVWDVSPAFRGVGVASSFIIAVINIYYTTPQAWALFYFVSSMAPQLPWSSCNSSWATVNCSNVTSAEEYFYHEVVKVTGTLTDWGEFNWQLWLCNMSIWVVIFAVICRGASSLGKVAYFTSLFPYVLLIGLLGYTLTLPGADEGVSYYVLPSISKLTNIRVWSVAVGQVFFSTGLGCGVVAQMSSYNKFKHDVLRDSVLVPISDALTSIFAGFSCFAILGYMSLLKSKPIQDVVSAGPSLIFVTYPEAFIKMPGGQVVAVFFFLMTCILGLSSSVPAVECICSIVADYIPWFKKTRLRNVSMRFGLCAIQFFIGTFFCFGNSYYSYSLIDDRVISYSLMAIGIFETVAIAWFYGPKRLLSNIEEMVGWSKWIRYFQYYFIICWTFICPAGILFIFILDVTDFAGMQVLSFVYPDWAIVLGWLLVSVCPLIIIAFVGWAFFESYRLFKLFWIATQPSQLWHKRADASVAVSQSCCDGQQENEGVSNVAFQSDSNEPTNA